MILSKEQINRYLRHIIIPEISGPGQKKIIESKILVIAGDAMEASYLLYYLSASGVGGISCCFKSCEGYEKVFKNVQDINSQCSIEMVDKKILDDKDSCFIQNNFTLSIFIAEKNKARGLIPEYTNAEMLPDMIPVIFSLYNGWKGAIRFINNRESLSELHAQLRKIGKYDPKYESQEEGSFVSKGFLGAIAAIEAIKYILNIGSYCEKTLYIDLLTMDFKRDKSEAINGFFSNAVLMQENTKNQAGYLSKYSISRKLKDCRVLIVGTGGLGSPAAIALASTGVGTIGLVDYDCVDASNLNRQILHSTSRLGIPKVDSAECFIKNTYNSININKYNMALDKKNIMEIIREYDVIIDAVDNFPTRYLLNDACFFAGKPMIEAGAVRFEGLNMTILPGEGTCYRCLFPEIPDGSSIQGCAEIGVLGPVPGVMGFIQAAETIKLLLGKGKLLVNRVMYFDALDLDFDIITINKSVKCRLCGDEPTITELMEYDFKCE